ncbi:MAG: membrane protein insertase YidC [Deltaproteobacteria bacterium]|nr:membrane protein insertase YidC [Deltaproteobacteria bacterium]
MENNRSILAVALIILLWSGYSMFFSPKAPPVEKAPQATVEQEAAKVKTVDIVPTIEKVEEIPVSESVKRQEKIITVKSDLFEIKLSTLGATIRDVTLDKFKISNQPDSKTYKLISADTDKQATFKTSGSEGLAIPSNLLFRLDGYKTDTIYLKNAEQNVRFSAVTASGLKIIKNYRFYANSYKVDVDVQIVNDTKTTKSGYFNLTLISVVPTAKSKGMSDRYTFIGPISFDGKDIIKEKLDDLDKSPKIYGDNIKWSGFVSKYFLTLVDAEKYTQKVQIEKKGDIVENRFISPFISLAPGKKTSLQYYSFLGPVDYDLLKAAGHQFERAKDYGFFSILAKPLMHVLKFFYKYLGNYGFAIILLTVCIKIIFWPLTQKSYRSMKGMQKLQPEMQKLREKYGKDKQRLNQEMMAFYKSNKVNPMGGCLPMIIQIPVFFALYQVLLGAIELRHAPFMFWLVDLSAKDPYYITPLIMGVTMFAQQKMTPTNMDPTQAKIMLLMPVVFTFLFLNFPSGLVLYWMVNNLLTILQQYLIRRQPD